MGPLMFNFLFLLLFIVAFTKAIVEKDLVSMYIFSIGILVLFYGFMAIRKLVRANIDERITFSLCSMVLSIASADAALCFYIKEEWIIATTVSITAIALFIISIMEMKYYRKNAMARK